MNKQTKDQDSEELEALFDSIISANNTGGETAGATSAGPESKADVNSNADVPGVMSQIGQLTRVLHETLRELGVSKEIEKLALNFPDARSRLDYVSTLTKQAADRVLNATEAAQPIVEKVGSGGKHLAEQWDAMFDNKLDVEQFRDLASHTRSYLHETSRDARDTHAYLLEIMMAQDFQDLTGQVIKRLIETVRHLEQQLLSLLLENAPPGIKSGYESGLMNGPVVDPDGRTDVVTNQDQVDDLLESLGF